MQTLSRLLAPLILCAAGVAQHDDCSLATPIAGTGSFPFTTVGATDSGLLASCNQVVPVAPSVDVWFAWTPAVSGDYHLFICDPDYDSALSLRDSCTSPDFECGVLGGCYQSYRNSRVVGTGLSAGTTYLVQVDGFAGDEGSGVLEIDLILPPANDDCVNATPIAGTGSFPFSTFAATDSIATVLCNSGSAGSPDVWFEWTTGSATKYEILVLGISTQSSITFRNSCDGPGLLCASYFNGTNPQTFSGLAPNTTYLLQIDGWNGSSGAGALEISLPPPPTGGDECSSPLQIAGVGSFPFDTAGATQSPLSLGCNPEPGADIWFAWTTGASTDYHLEICSAGFDVVLSFMNSCAGPTLACSDGFAACGGGTSVASAELDLLGLSPNTTYIVRIDGWAGGTGTGVLDITAIGPPIGTAYCASTVNSSGQAAVVEVHGSASVAAQELTLIATGLPPDVNGLFFYGTGTTQSAFGDGFRCVAGGVQRLPIDSSDLAGKLSQPNVWDVPTPAVPITLGSTLNFQAWFRDPVAMQAGFNLSDGGTVTFLP